MKRRDMLAILAGAMAGPLATGARGQAWPSRTMRLVVPFPAGGSADFSARLLAENLRGGLGQPVIVENKPGSGGNIAAAEAARAEPDGHTLFVGTNGTQAINASLYKRLPFDPERDFAPVGLIWEAPNLVVVAPALPVRTLPELVAYARDNPGKLNFGSSGVGSATHLAGEMFNALTGARLTHVPYRGQGPAITDLMAGRIEAMFPIVPDILAQVQAGTVRAVAVAAPQRSSFLPDLATAGEGGVPGLVASAWLGLFAPRQVPPAVVDRLAGELARLAADAEFQRRLNEAGIAARPLAGAAFAAKIADERRAWAKLVGDLGIGIE